VTTQPRWEDSGQGDLLELVAMGSSTGTADAEWRAFVCCLRVSAWGPNGRISPNTLRREVRGDIAPKRIGAFTSRAVARGLIEATGEWEVSDDREGRNAGRPARVYRWIGGEL
jgi:hypothetical protein